MSVIQSLHAYGTPAITPANYSATGGAQNAHVIATGSTGLGELGRQTERTLSQWSTLMTETTGGLLVSLHGTTGVALTAVTVTEEDFVSGGDVGDTTGTAAALTDIAAPLSGFDHAGHAFSEIGFAGDVDLFALTLDAPGTISAEVVHANRWGSTLDTFLEIFDTDGTSLLLANDDAVYSGDEYGAGGFGSSDSFLINVTAPTAGTYFLRVSAANGTDTGNYSLIYGADTIAAIPEPGGIAFLTLLGICCYARRRRWA